MNNFRSIKYSAILLPALAMGVSVASAEDDKRNDPCDDQRTTAVTDQDRGRVVTDNPALTSNRAYTAAGTKDGEKANSWDKNSTLGNDKMASSHMNGQDYLETKPVNNFFSTNLIGQEVTNNRNGEVVGTVDEILIDRDGQVAAVVLSIGGLMGLGEKEVAISWDQITRSIDGDDVNLTVDLSEASLSAAPTFSRD